MDQTKLKEYMTTDELGAVKTGTAPNAQFKLLNESIGRKTYALVLATGDEIGAGIKTFATQQNIKAGYFQAVGAAHSVSTAWYDISRKQYKITAIDGQIEILSLLGDFGMKDGKSIVHMHITCGLPDGTVQGGHLVKGIVSPTLEVFVTALDAELIKQHDDASGLNLFNLKA